VKGLSSPNKIVVNPTGTKMYVTSFLNNVIYIVNTKTNTVIATVPIGTQPNKIAVNPSGTMVYVLNGNNVSVINTKINTVAATIPVGVNPNEIAITPDGTKAYVVNMGTFENPDNTISIIDTATNTVVATMPVGVNPSGIAITPDGTKVYVTNSDGVSVIATSTNTTKVSNFHKLNSSKAKASLSKYRHKNHSKHHRTGKNPQVQNK
jgi:YVTN family beta-propeller protein